MVPARHRCTQALAGGPATTYCVPRSFSEVRRSGVFTNHIILLEPSEEGEVVTMHAIHSHWTPAERYYEYRKTKGAFKLAEEPVAFYTQLDMTETHDWAISDPARATSTLDNAFIALYDTYLATI